MSLLSMAGGATGTGTVTLLAPVTNTNRTITLPDATGTVLTNATTTGFPAGSVLQVVQATFSTEVSTTSSTFSDTGLTASITPSSASNQVLILVSVQGQKNGSTGLDLRVLRGATNIIQFAKNAGYTGASDYNIIGSVSCGYVDSPATTSSTTYKVQLASNANVSLARINDNTQSSTITLMEIAA